MPNPPILFIGEAYGEAEARLGKPFVGPSGAALLRMLGEAGIIKLAKPDQRALTRFYETSDSTALDYIWTCHAHEIVRTNVFNLHPPGNDMAELCGPKTDALPGYPVYTKSKYIRREFEPELDRLCHEILTLNPNLIVCLGNTPLWALSGRTGIKAWRGTTMVSTHTVADFKLLSTYHPAAVLRGWDIRPIVIADLMKAQRESAYPELRRTPREIWIEPTLADVCGFFTGFVKHNNRVLSVDIETTGTRITCIGLGYANLAIVIPFDDERRTNGSYWPTQQDERACWGLIDTVLGDPTIPKLFQNGLYDIAFLWRSMGVKVLGAQHDTMLLHHALQPESIKSLGFLGSVYADEGAWKHLGKRVRKTIKRDN
jgi:uracil-DNA glycosylase